MRRAICSMSLPRYLRTDAYMRPPIQGGRAEAAQHRLRTYTNGDAAATASEVAAAGQALRRLGARELVDRDAVAAGRLELAAGPVRNAEHRLTLPAAAFQLGDRGVQPGDAVDQHGAISLQMTGEQDVGRLAGQADHRDPGVEGLDCELQVGAQHAREVLDVASHVVARHVEEVEPFEGRP